MQSYRRNVKVMHTARSDESAFSLSRWNAGGSLLDCETLMFCGCRVRGDSENITLARAGTGLPL